MKFVHWRNVVYQKGANLMNDLTIFQEPFSPWMHEQGPFDDIVLSSRVRLARNLQRYTFPKALSIEMKQEITQKMADKFNEKTFCTDRVMHIFHMDELTDLQKSVLVEKHLVSPLLTKTPGSSVLISSDEQLSIMIHEEDHLRIQSMFTGIQIARAYELANQMDDWLETQLDYAFDENFGYLTSCPTNVGTGLRCSVMLHLPGLVMTKQMDPTVHTLNRLGFVVRGIYGEGTTTLGHLFQLSNQVTLGKTESEMVDELTKITEKIVEQERHARDHLMTHARFMLEDRIFRSLGTLKYAILMQSKEAAERLSDILLGIYLGFIEGMSIQQIRQLFTWIQPGFLQVYAGKSLDINEREVARANLLRKYLA